jgi:hypothetical protein
MGRALDPAASSFSLNARQRRKQRRKQRAVEEKAAPSQTPQLVAGGCADPPKKSDLVAHHL